VRDDAIAVTATAANNEAMSGKPVVQQMDVNVNGLGIFRAAVRIVCPNQPAKLFAADTGMPLDRA
jgi:hypothetical protein